MIDCKRNAKGNFACVVIVYFHGGKASCLIAAAAGQLRKVRATQSAVPPNGWGATAQAVVHRKCHRKHTARRLRVSIRVRVKRQGKSLPGRQ